MKQVKRFSYFVIFALFTQGCIKKSIDYPINPSVIEGKYQTFAVSTQSTIYNGYTITFSNNVPIGTIKRAKTGQSGALRDAYDYSTDLVVDGSNWRLFNGGRFKDQTSDGDHIFERSVIYINRNDSTSWNSANSYVSPVLNPTTSVTPSPLWRNGQDIGVSATVWHSGNALEPEVMKVGSTWYCFSQTQITNGRYIDAGVNETPDPGYAADRIKLYTSSSPTSGWTRVTKDGNGNTIDRGVIINIPAATRKNTQIDHQEVMYEADSIKPWVMYFHYFVNGAPQGFLRIRSTDPTTFDWNSREVVTGMSQLGNKIGYAVNLDGRKKLYIRITFVPNASGVKVPSFQFSVDGINFGFGTNQVNLQGPTDGNNIYFLGFSTINGTGSFGPSNANNNNWDIVYGGAACKSPVAPDIFYSDTWLGRTRINIAWQ